MKKVLFILPLLCLFVLIGCKKDNKSNLPPLKQLTEYYNSYAQQLKDSKDSKEVETLTNKALEDFEKIVMENKDYFIKFMKENKYAVAKDVEADVNEMQDAWKKCNLVLSEKTNGQWEYMPDLLSIYDILHEYISTEETVPQSAPFVFGSDNDGCDHEHEHCDSTHAE